MPEPITKKAWLDRYTKMANANYANHELVVCDIDAGRFVVKQPGTNNFWTEIICTRAGLIVHGDISLACFERCDNTEPIGQLKWMGGRPRVCSYVMEKFRIGMGDHGWLESLAYDWDEGVALTQVNEEVARHDDNKDDWGNEEEWEDVHDAWQEFRDGVMDARDLRQLNAGLVEMLHDAGYDEPPLLGRVPSHRVISAHTAVRRAVELLPTVM